MHVCPDFWFQYGTHLKASVVPPMFHKTDKIVELLYKHILCSATNEEKAQIDLWRQESPENEQLFQEWNDRSTWAAKFALYRRANTEVELEKAQRIIREMDS